MNELSSSPFLSLAWKLFCNFFPLFLFLFMLLSFKKIFYFFCFSLSFVLLFIDLIIYLHLWLYFYIFYCFCIVSFLSLKLGNYFYNSSPSFFSLFILAIKKTTHSFSACYSVWLVCTFQLARLVAFIVNSSFFIFILPGYSFVAFPYWCMFTLVDEWQTVNISILERFLMKLCN